MSEDEVDAGDVMSEAFEVAVRCRAEGNGLVPVAVLRLLTPAEWSVIRLMNQHAARQRLLEVVARVQTTVIDPELLDLLRKT